MTVDVKRVRLEDADLEDAISSLTRYARGFFLPDAQGRAAQDRAARDWAAQDWAAQDWANVELKLAHCLRVFQEAKAIVAKEGLARDAARAALWAALFHDIGRFPQYARYTTFNDRKSEDHGRLGARILKQSAFLSSLEPQLQKVVLAAVVLHNRRFLPLGLPERFAVPAKVVRDADKLDIFAVMLTHLRPGALANHVVTLGLRDDSLSYTKEILVQVRQGCLVDYTKMVWINDFRLLLCSWIYDLNFASSRNTLLERGHLDELLAHLPETEEIRQVARKVRVDLKAMVGVRSGQELGSRSQEPEFRIKQIDEPFAF
jgi:putative nucleotidyltransferase with HDIG domain